MKLTRSKTLREAGHLKDLLLYQVSGGIMGSDPKVIAEKKGIILNPVEGVTFGEALGLFNGILKLNEQEEKYKPDGGDRSPFAALKAGVKYGSQAVADTGDTGDIGEDTADDTASNDLHSGT